MRIIMIMDIGQIIFRAILLFLLIYFVIFPIYSAYRFAHPPRVKVTFFTPTTLGVAYEDITLKSKDGTMLEGWYIPSRNGAAVILLHGLGSNRLMMVEYAESLLRANYGVLLFDLRAHGNNARKIFARSQEGVDDVLTAVTYLSKRKDVTAAGIGVVGVSIGGLFALQAAAQTVAVRAVFVDGASPAVFADLPKAQNLWQQVQFALERFYLKMTDLFTGKPHLPSNLAILPKIAPRPLFLVSTGTRGEKRMIEGYMAVAGEPKTWWQIPEARHARGWLERPDEYNQKLIAFFDKALMSQSKSRIQLPDIEEDRE